MTTSTARAACGSLDERSLLRAAQHHDWAAHEQLLERFRPLLDAAVHRSRLPDGLDREDLAQEARIAFLRAIARWRPERGPFPAFARTCVRNYVLNVLAAAGAGKHQILSHAHAITGPDPGDWQDQHAAIDHFAWRCDNERPLVGQGADPEAVVLAREQLESVRVAMRSLTAWEQTALKAAVNGVSHRQIALEHGVSVRAVTLAVRRGRHKLSERARCAQIG
jgi:RNA polymerase sigma factor (sigma-70 family)